MLQGSRLPRALHLLVPTTSLFVFLSGLLGVCGWQFHIYSLKTWLPLHSRIVAVTISPNTAAAFVLMGMACWLKRNSARRAAGFDVANAFALLVAILGVLSLLEYLFGWNLKIDQMLFAVRPGDEINTIHLTGLMAPLTALNFLLLGAALLLLDSGAEAGGWASQLLCVVAQVFALFGVLDFALDPYSPPHTYMALPTAVTLLVLSLGILSLRQDRGFVAPILSEGPQGTCIRRLLAVLTAVPVLLAMLLRRGFEAEFAREWGLISTATIFVSTLLAAAITWTAFVRREDSETQSGSPEGRVGVVFTISVGLLIGMGALTWWSARKAVADEAWVAHTYSVMRTVEATHGDVRAAAAAARAFSQTGDIELLPDYLTNRRKIDVDLASLLKLTSDDSLQQPLLANLSARVHVLLAMYEGMIEERRRG
ncbi:MAG: CHASE3 domain-containing protein [Candidatus Sulfotelmatobacter sp.]